MIDYQTRRLLREERKQKAFLSQVEGNVQRVLKETTSPDNSEVVTLLGKIGRALAIINSNLPKQIPFPKLFQTEVQKMPPVRVENLSEIVTELKKLDRQIVVPDTMKIDGPIEVTNFPGLINSITALNKKIEGYTKGLMEMRPAAINIPEIKIPEIKIPKQTPTDLKPLLTALENLQNALGQQQPPKIDNEDLIAAFRRVERGIQALVDRPVMTPQPVTNVWINPAQGFLHSTSNTVGTSVARLPNYGQLFNRRALIIYNNSANVIYYGGSDVTVSNGVPIPPGAYVPVEAGYNLTVYAIAGQNGNDVRVIEISKDRSTNVQE